MATPYRQLELRRGLKADLPVLAEGEPGFCTDTGELFIGTLSGNVAVGYLPESPGNWVDPAPTSLANAIDRLAAAWNAQTGNPIP